VRIAIDGLLVNRGETGVENAILELARALAAGGQEEYRLFLRADSPLPDITGPRFLTRRCRLPARSRLLRILYQQTVLPWRVRAAACDLLHAPGYVAPLVAGAPAVLTVYDLIALRFPQWCKRSNALNYRLQMPLSIRRARRIIVPSQSTRHDLVGRFPGAAGKVRVIPLGVAARFRPCTEPAQRQAVRERYALPPRFILFLGHNEPKKNLPGIVAGFCGLRKRSAAEVRLVIAGARGWGCGAVEGQLRESGLAAAVHRVGYVPPEDLPCLYGLAEVFVFPSLYEGFGLPPLEAMACGTPVVASDRGALPEVLGNAAIQVDPEDPAALAAALQAVLGDPARRGQMVEKGLRQAARFPWEQTARLTEDCLREARYGVAAAGSSTRREGR